VEGDAELQLIKQLAADGRISIEGDANWPMGAWGMTTTDVRNALLTATACEDHGTRTHVIGGTDLDGNPVNIVLRMFPDDVSIEGFF